jgi:hypothetical protein
MRTPNARRARTLDETKTDASIEMANRVAERSGCAVFVDACTSVLVTVASLPSKNASVDR